MPGHLDQRITVTTPLQKAGVYFLTARMEGGNTSRIVVWLNDTVIIKKDFADKEYFFVADVRTGHPVPRADDRAVRLDALSRCKARDRVAHRDPDAATQDRR